MTILYQWDEEFDQCSQIVNVAPTDIRKIIEGIGLLQIILPLRVGQSDPSQHRGHMHKLWRFVVEGHTWKQTMEQWTNEVECEALPYFDAGLFEVVPQTKHDMDFIPKASSNARVVVYELQHNSQASIRTSKIKTQLP
jgi:hypothetical protein